MKILLFISIISFSLSQEILTDYLIIDGDTLDNFVYQLPNHVNPDESSPLLVVFHQWGGSAISTTGTQFDEEAYNRGWYFLAPWGGSTNNYNHQRAQEYVEWAIIWIQNNFSCTNCKH